MTGASNQPRQSANNVVSLRGANPRPQYTPPAPSQTNSRSDWLKSQLPGGPKLFCRLVAGFASVATVGLVLIVISGVYFQSALEHARQDGQSMPLILAVVGLVSGVMFFCGSFVLGKIMISKKWRKPRVEVTARFTVPSSDAAAEHVEIQIHGPPSYDEAIAEPPPVPGLEPYTLTLSDNDIMPPVTDTLEPPPRYTVNDLPAPPAYTPSEINSSGAGETMNQS